MFQAGSGSNFIIQGGNFIQHNHKHDESVNHFHDAEGAVLNVLVSDHATAYKPFASIHPGVFKQMIGHVAPAAFDSEQQGEAPKCHKNTRKVVLREIMDWVLRERMRTAWVLWLNGAAGAGKSAIMCSVIELCIQQYILVAKFFFFRTDPTRNTIKPLAVTLAYQLIQLIPTIKELVLSTIQNDPLIFSQSFETQFRKLIIEPLQQFRSSGHEARWPVVFLIDGVDECNGQDDQSRLIHTLATAAGSKDLPLVVLFSSRAENHLQMAFNSPRVADILFRLPLDNHYLPDKDIRLFLNDGFEDIKLTHPFNNFLDRDWPTQALVQEIVDKSSGQFIYASVVMKFLSFPHSNPAQQLEIVRGLRPSGLSTPFAQLDSLYQHIFSQVQDIERTRWMLAYIILRQDTSISCISRFFDISVANVPTALAELTSVVVCEHGRVDFLHASLPDFLMDASRSLKYHTAAEKWFTRLSIFWLQKSVASGRYTNEDDILLLLHAEPTGDMHKSILTVDPSNFKGFHVEFMVDYLTAVSKLNFGDGSKVYRHQLNRMVRSLKMWNLEGLSFGPLQSDVAQLAAELRREEQQRPLKRSRRLRIKAWLLRSMKSIWTPRS